jgi:hypothetical protein
MLDRPPLATMKTCLASVTVGSESSPMPATIYETGDQLFKRVCSRVTTVEGLFAAFEMMGAAPSQ